MDPTKRCWSGDLGKLILRLTIGGLMLFHGAAKIRGGIDFINGQLAAQNLPTFLAYGVYIGEVLAPILVLVGFLTRPAALVIAIDMIVAVALVHREQLSTIGQSGGWGVELPALYCFGALAIVFLGAGRLSVDGARRTAATGPVVAEPAERRPVR